MKYTVSNVAFFTLMVMLSMWIPVPFSLGMPFGDKIMHVLAYGFLTYAFSQIVSIRKSVLIVFLLSIGLEMSQYFIPYRSVQVSDALSNSIGILVVWLWHRVKHVFN